MFHFQFDTLQHAAASIFAVFACCTMAVIWLAIAR